MTGAGAWRTSCCSVAVRAAWTGMPCLLSLSLRYRAIIGWPGRWPGNSQFVSLVGASECSSLLEQCADECSDRFRRRHRWFPERPVEPLTASPAGEQQTDGAAR